MLAFFSGTCHHENEWCELDAFNVCHEFNGHIYELEVPKTNGKRRGLSNTEKGVIISLFFVYGTISTVLVNYRIISHKRSPINANVIGPSALKD